MSMMRGWSCCRRNTSTRMTARVAAEVAAKTLLESRGNSPRLFRNSLVFLAADKARMQDLDDAVRRYLAWKSIVDEADVLDLGKHQRGQAETQLKAAEAMVLAKNPRDVPVDARSGPGESTGGGDVSGDTSVGKRCSRRPRQQEAEERRAARDVSGADDPAESISTMCRSGQRGTCRSVSWSTTSRRTSTCRAWPNSDVLVSAIKAGLALLTWTSESFALRRQLRRVRWTLSWSSGPARTWRLPRRAQDCS